MSGAPLDLLERAGGLERLAQADAFEIAALLDGRDLDALEGGDDKSSRRRSPARGSFRSAEVLAAAFELGRRTEIARERPLERLTSAGDVAKWAMQRLGSLAHEELWMLALDGRGRLRAARCVAKGGLHGAAVRRADPLRAALRVDASAFVLVHNHPSGDPTPSKEDIALTAQVAAGAEIVGVPLLDHVVVVRDGFACVPVAHAPNGEHHSEPRG